MTTLENARRQYWLTVVYPSICDMLAQTSRRSEGEADGGACDAPPTLRTGARRSAEATS
jgi:hypothetical protein